jgi:phospholipase/lecithinase/hemolysin
MLQSIAVSRPDLRLTVVDIQSGLSDLIANPATYGFTKTFPSALDDPTLPLPVDLRGPGADYVFWNSLHPTSKTQSFIANWSLNAVQSTVLEALDGGLSGSTLNLRAQKLQIGQDYTLQRSPDLRNWADVSTFTAAFGTNFWPITVGNVSASYFRLRRQ